MTPQLRIGKIVFIVIFTAFIYRCGEDIEDPYPPAKPRWVEKSAPEDTVEKGIDAETFGNKLVIFLEWYRNEEEDISGYELYRAGNRPENGFSIIANVNIYTSPGSDTLYYDNQAEIGVDYYYFLRAYDNSGNMSEHSDTVRYRLTQAIYLNSPHGEISVAKPTFEWSDFSTETYEYVIKIGEIGSSNFTWVYRMSRPNYADYLQSIKYNFSNSASLDSLVVGKSYRWRVDGIAMVNNDNIDIAGSESCWGYFLIK